MAAPVELGNMRKPQLLECLGESWGEIAALKGDLQTAQRGLSAKRSGIQKLERQLAQAVDRAEHLYTFRDTDLEALMVWAKQHGCSFVDSIAEQYAMRTGTTWRIAQAQYELFEFADPVPPC